jgi:cytidylate kinase
MIIAVDGPAASGKGTIAKGAGPPFRPAPYGYRPPLPRGALNLLQMDGDPESEFSAARACDIAQIDFADPQLKSEAVGGIASRISAYPMVREHLLERQRMFAAQAGGAVLDGRDIGTVIAPDAEAKLFITATAEVRARRRCHELQSLGLNVHYDDVLADIHARDERDASRAAAPLVPASDAMIIDTVRSASRKPSPPLVRGSGARTDG